MGRGRDAQTQRQSSVSSGCNRRVSHYKLTRSSQATELTLEDRITERLKAYQRQLAQVHEHDEL